MMAKIEFLCDEGVNVDSQIITNEIKNKIGNKRLTITHDNGSGIIKIEYNPELGLDALTDAEIVSTRSAVKALPINAKDKQ